MRTIERVTDQALDALAKQLADRLNRMSLPAVDRNDRSPHGRDSRSRDNEPAALRS